MPSLRSYALIVIPEPSRLPCTCTADHLCAPCVASGECLPPVRTRDTLRRSRQRLLVRLPLEETRLAVVLAERPATLPVDPTWQRRKKRAFENVQRTRRALRTIEVRLAGGRADGCCFSKGMR